MPKKGKPLFIPMVAPVAASASGAGPGEPKSKAETDISTTTSPYITRDTEKLRVEKIQKRVFVTLDNRTAYAEQSLCHTGAVRWKTHV